MKKHNWFVLELAALLAPQLFAAASLDTVGNTQRSGFLRWVGNWLFLDSFMLLGVTPAQSVFSDTSVTNSHKKGKAASVLANIMAPMVFLLMWSGATLAQSDLIIQNLSVNPNSGTAGSNATVSFALYNQGNSVAFANTTNVRINTSTSNVTASDSLLLSLSIPSIPAGSYCPVTQNINISSNRPTGNNYIWVIADVNSDADQSNENNDYAYTVFTVRDTVAQSDLIIQNLSVSPNSGTAGSNATVSFTLYNQGSGVALANTTNVRINTSTSNVTGSDSLLRSLSIPNISAGSSYFVNETINISSDRPAGNNYIWVIADVDSSANQSNEYNDRAYTAFTVAAITPTPSVSSISPTTMTADNTSHALTIYGSNFQSGNIVRFKWGAGSGAGVWNMGNSPSINSTSQITVNMNPGAVNDTIYMQVCSTSSATACSSGAQFVTVTASSGGSSILGIDISGYQGSVDWSQVVSDGRTFAFVKATEGTRYVSGWPAPVPALPSLPQHLFNENVDAAKAITGLYVGVYHLANPNLNPGQAGAVAEATLFLKYAGKYIGPGYLPPVLDLEPGSTTEGITGATLANWINYWIGEIRNQKGSTVTPIIYIHSSIINALRDSGVSQSLAGYPLWIVNWQNNPTANPGNITPWTKWTFQQYISGEGGGVCCGESSVDLDSFNGSLSDLQNLVGSTSTVPAVSTDAPSVITANSAMLKGTVNPNGVPVTAVSFDFGATTAYSQNFAAVPASIPSTTVATAVSFNKTGLICNTTYHYRVKAVNSVGTFPGTDRSFTTSACTANVDLTITNAVLTPAAPVTNGTFNATITVKNQGTGTGDGKFLDVWSHQPAAQACGAVGNKRVAVGAIAAGASKALTVTGLPAGIAGSKMLRAFVDSGCGTVESNDNNNQLTALYSVNQATGINFTVTLITLNPATPVANGTFNAVVQVKNLGTVAGDGKFLDVWSNQPAGQVCSAVGNKRLAVGVLAAGAAKNITFTGLAAGVAGAKTFRAFVDSACGTGENNEGNNQSTKAYSVQ